MRCSHRRRARANDESFFEQRSGQAADAAAMKILVVEDSSSMRAFLTTIIEGGTESYDLEVVEASSGFEALKSLPHHKFDAILTDINMPDINGLELVSFLKNHPVYRTIPIMVISTEGSDADRRRAAAPVSYTHLRAHETPE